MGRIHGAIDTIAGQQMEEKLVHVLDWAKGL